MQGYPARLASARVGVGGVSTVSSGTGASFAIDAAVIDKKSARTAQQACGEATRGRVVRAELGDQSGSFLESLETAELEYAELNSKVEPPTEGQVANVILSEYFVELTMDVDIKAVSIIDQIEGGRA